MFYRYRFPVWLLIVGTFWFSNGFTGLHAADNHWNPSSRNDKNWFAPELWSLGHTPTLQDRVFIEKAYLANLLFTRTELSGTNGYAGELHISGGSKSNGPSLYIHDATLQIGTLLSLGGNQSKSGSLLVEGEDAAAIGESGAKLIIGGSGSGTFQIDLGAKVRFDGGTTIGRDLNSTGYLRLYDLDYPERPRAVLEAAFIERGKTSSGDVALYVHGGMIRATQNEDRFLRNFPEGTITIGNNHFYFDTNGYNVTIADGTHFGGVGIFNKVGSGTLTLAITSDHDYGYNFGGGTTRFKGGVHDGKWGGIVVGTASGVEASVVIEEQAVFNYRYIGLGLFGGQKGNLMIRERSQVNLAALRSTEPSVSIGGTGDARMGLESGAHLDITDSSVESGLGWIRIAQGSRSTGTLDFGSPDLGTPTTTGFLTAERIEFGEGSGLIRFNQTDALTLDVDIVGKGYVQQRGIGRTVMTGKIGPSVMTVVSQGTLVADGEFENFIQLEEGRLEGTGRLSIVYFDGGILAPGRSQGVMKIGSMLWADGVIEFDLGSSPEESDLLQINQLSLSGNRSTHQWTFKDNGWQVGDTYALLTLGTGTLDPTRFSFTNGDGFDGEFSFAGDTLQFTLHAIPEPRMVALLLTGGLLALKYRSWKRRRQL